MSTAIAALRITDFPGSFRVPHAPRSVALEAACPFSAPLTMGAARSAEIARFRPPTIRR